MAADRIPFLSIRMIADESLPQAKRPLRQDAGARDAVSESSPSLGRAHRVGAGAGAQLAAKRGRQYGAGRRTRRRSGLARDARHRGAMGRPGRPTRPSAGGSAGDRGLQTDRRADRLASGALYRTGAVDPGRSDHRAAELARGLRLRHRPRRAGAQRLRSHQRSLRQGRQGPDRGRCLQRDPCLAGFVPARLGRAPLRERQPGVDRALDRDCHHRHRDPARRRQTAPQPARGVRSCPQLVEGARLMRSRSLLHIILCTLPVAGCANNWKPPQIGYDDLEPAVLQAEPPKPIEVVELPKALALPGQLKPLPGKTTAKPEPKDPKERVAKANDAARVEPTRHGYLNAVQVYPFVDGALYQVYTAPGQVTDIALQEGEQLVGSGPVAAGDTVRWVIGDTESGTGPTKRIHILAKPTRPDLTTNLVINTDRRTYLMELRSTEKTYMASVSWQYPQDQLIALRRQNLAADASAPRSRGGLGGAGGAAARAGARGRAGAKGAGRPRRHRRDRRGGRDDRGAGAALGAPGQRPRTLQPRPKARRRWPSDAAERLCR